MTRVAVDAMGGDYAPAEITRGALEACQDRRVQLVLVGNEEKIRREIRKLPPNLAIHHTDEVISMEEPPSQAIKKKRRASLVLAAELVRNGEANALLSAGNTGALLEASVFILGRMRGIRRPAIATFWPTRNGFSLLLDSGANAECKAEHLLQFALMGSLFAERVFGIHSPRVGLLNIGEESHKGTQELQEAFHLLQESHLNFVGNIEPAGFLLGEATVAVCSGFIGNMVLKTAEGVSEFLFDVIKKELTKRVHTKVLSGFLRPTFRAIRKQLDYAEYGAAPFLGVNAVCLKSHGKSKAKAIKNAVYSAIHIVESGVMEELSHLTDSQKEPGPKE